MNKSIFIYGAGGLGKELLLVCHRSGREVAGFLDDRVSPGSTIHGKEVLGDFDWLRKRSIENEILIALGSAQLRKKLSEKLNALEKISLCSFISDPSALMLNTDGIKIGKGSVITAGCILTTDIIIGNNVLVNLNTTIGHDTVIGDHSALMPGCNIAGGVSIGSGVFIGTGAMVLNGVSIGDDATIGAGSVVNKDVGPGQKVIGVPARTRSK